MYEALVPALNITSSVVLRSQNLFSITVSHPQISLLFSISPCCVISCCNPGPAESSTLTHVSSLHCLQSFHPCPQPNHVLHTHIWLHLEQHTVWLCTESCSRVQHYLNPTQSWRGNGNGGSSKGSVWLEARSVIPVASPLRHPPKKGLCPENSLKNRTEGPYICHRRGFFGVAACVIFL